MALPNRNVRGYHLRSIGYKSVEDERKYVDNERVNQPCHMLIQDTEHGSIVVGKIYTDELAHRIERLLNAELGNKPKTLVDNRRD